MDTQHPRPTVTTAPQEPSPGLECEICGDRTPPERYLLREMLFGTRESFAYSRCPACGVLHIDQPPADMAPYYPAGYYGDPSGPTGTTTRTETGLTGFAGRSRDQATLFGHGRRLARVMRRWAPQASPELRRLVPFVQRVGLRSFDDPILDVGCGRQASYLARLQAVGFRHLTGIDPFLEAEGDFHGIPLLKRSIHEVIGTFRLITFHHSFEHVPDPEATLSAAASHLGPGGSILIRTPVMGGWFWETFGTDWWELDAPRHLWVHSEASLATLAARTGLTVADVAWDSTFVEVIASEQIARDIAWHEPSSWNVHPPAGYDDQAIASHVALVAELNASGRAGRAGFHLRRR